MGRIRSIKPEFPQSETTGRLTRDARLLFIQLWTIVDDSGRSRAASRMLASLLYPYDDDAPKLMVRWLDELEREACIRRYTVDGAQYLEITNWLKHQKIDKPSKSRLPSFVEGSSNPREPSRTLAPDLGPRTLDMDQDLGPENARKRATRLPEDWLPSIEDGQYALAKGLTQAEAQSECEKFRNYWQAKSGQTATKLDWSKTWQNWIITTVERKGKPHGTGSNGRRPSLSDRAGELAEQARQQELEAGFGRPDAPVGSA